MNPRDIVVFVEGEAGRDARLAFAANLAAKWGAHLTAVCIARRLDFNMHIGFAIGDGLKAALRDHDAKARESKARTRWFFEDLLHHHGLVGEWRYVEDGTQEDLVSYARHAGLAIVGPPELQAEEPTTLGLSEDVIFSSGRPSLLLPTDWPADRIGKRITIGWNASREATLAIANAMPFLVAAEVVHVIVVADAGTGEGHGAEPGADISRHLARHGVPLTLERISGPDAGIILVERSMGLDADLLVMGAYGHFKITELIFGGVTRTVLRKAALPLLLSR